MKVYLVVRREHNLESVWDTWEAAREEVFKRVMLEEEEVYHFRIQELELNQGYLWDKRESLQAAAADEEGEG